MSSMWRWTFSRKKAYNLQKTENVTMKATFLGVFKGKYLRGKNKVSGVYLTNCLVKLLSEVVLYLKQQI